MSTSTSFDISEDGNWLCFDNFYFYNKSQIVRMKISCGKVDGKIAKYYVTFYFSEREISDMTLICGDEERAREIVHRITTPFQTLKK